MMLLTLAGGNAKINHSSNEVDDDKKAPHPHKHYRHGKNDRGRSCCQGTSFVDQERTALIPNDFVVEQDFETTIRGMESQLMGSKDGGAIARRSTGMDMTQADGRAQEMSVKEHK
jgi:hypothetical protein